MRQCCLKETRQFDVGGNISRLQRARMKMVSVYSYA